MKPIKQTEVKERVIGDYSFFIRPFPAFTAANISGELFALILPVIGSFVPGAVKTGTFDTSSFLDLDAEDAAPVLARGLSDIKGDKVESLLKTLLCKHKNIAVEFDGNGKPKPLTEDLANEIFCGDVQDMFVLAFDVIKTNYSSFFRKAGGPFGSRTDEFSTIRKKPPASKNTES